MQTFTSCRNSVRCKRWIQHQCFFSVVSCLDLKACSLVVNRVVDGYGVVKKRGPTADGQLERSTASRSEESRGTCHREEANQILKLVSPFSFHCLFSRKHLGTLSVGPSFVTLIQHVRQLSPRDGCAFGCTPLYGLL